MAHASVILPQILKFVPRHEFDTLAKQYDGARRSDGMSPWTQFMAIATAHLTGRCSLRDIESTLNSQNLI